MNSGHISTMPPLTMPLYTMPMGVPFLRGLAVGLRQRFPDLAACHIVLPTQRACVEFRDHLAQQHGDATFILPRVTALGHLDEVIAPARLRAGLPPYPRVMGDAERLLLLERCLKALLPKILSQSQQLEMVRALVRLLDLGYQHAVDWRKLHAMVPEHLATHWQNAHELLVHLTHQWPQILRQKGVIESEDLQNQLVAWLIQTLDARQGIFDGPLIIAGSTGSIARTAKLMEAVVTSGSGAVVLPFFDPAAMTDDEASRASSTSPYASMSRVLKRLHIVPGAVSLWTPQSADHSSTEPPHQHWIQALGPCTTSLSSKDQLRPTPLLQMLECANLREEAQVIALMIREHLAGPAADSDSALSNPGRIAVMSPHDGLLQSIQAELRRWGIDIDLPQPLARTGPGIMLHLILQMARVPDSVSALSLLKHPLFNTDLLKGSDEPLSPPLSLSRFEKLVLRQGEASRHAFITSLPAGSLKETLRKVFPDSLAKRSQPLAAWAQWHTTALKDLTHPEIWDGSACDMVTELLRTLSEERDAQSLTLQDYHEWVQALSAGRSLQPTYQVRCPVALLNPREARLLTFDHVIIAGMNEGIWPAASADNPWLTAAMMRHLGLPTAADYAGLAAHDLVQWGAQARRITLTRARSADGRPANPSRWWWRLQPYAASSSSTLATYRHWLEIAAPPAVQTSAPAPCPPAAARPRRVSVTAMETLLRNPYEFYVRQVLRLRSLEPLQGDLRTLGRLVHALLEQWVLWLTEFAQTDATNPFDPDAVLPLVQERLGGARHEDEAVRSLFLQARLRRIFAEFLAREKIHQNQVRTRWVELAGEATFLDALGEPFVLLAKADRLDLLGDGAVEFYDYKTGQVPSLRALKQGRALQLPLECAIFARGGFAASMDLAPMIMPVNHVRALHYWQLKGGAKPAKWVSLAGPDLAPVITQAEQCVAQVMAHFQHAPYVYQDDGFAGPIAHLARVTAGSHAIEESPSPWGEPPSERAS